MGIKNKKGFHRVKRVVCDTGPILHLKEADLLYLLTEIERVYIPKMIDTELTEIISSWEDQKPSWTLVETLLETESSQAEILYRLGLLGAGELKLNQPLVG